MHPLVRTALMAISFGFASTAYSQTAAEMPTRLWAGQTSASQAMLRWDTVAGASEYRLYQRISSTETRPIASPARNAHSWVIPLNASMAGKTLQYLLSAVHPNAGESPIVPFNAITIVAASATPTAPTGVMAALTDSSEITLRWDSVPGATGYAIARSITPYGFATLCAFCPIATEYIDRAVTFGQAHTYTVEAITAGGRSRRTTSNMVGVPLPGAAGLSGPLLDVVSNSSKTAVGALRLPNPPISITATATTGGVDVGWFASGIDSVSSFVIERAVNLGSFKPLASVAGDQRTYPDRTLPNIYEGGQMRLTYRVTSSNRLGTSPVSAQASVVITNPTAASTPSFCTIEYKRADNMWAERGKATALPGLETLRLNVGANQMFKTDWSYEGRRNDGRNYYGAHLRQLLNTGPRDVIVYARSLDPYVVAYTVDVQAARNVLDLANQVIKNTMALSAFHRHGVFAVEIKVRPGDVLGVRADLLEVVCPKI